MKDAQFSHCWAGLSADLRADNGQYSFSPKVTPVLAKHSKSFSLIDCISVGVDRMQRNFEPMRKHSGGVALQALLRDIAQGVRR